MFASTAEAEKYIGGVFEAGFAVPEIRDKLVKSQLVLRMELTEPDAVITADTINQTLHYGECDIEPTITLRLSSTDANRFWQGKLSLPLALARKQLTISGPVPKLLALLPSASALNSEYTDTLARDGRTDLLV